MRHPFDFSGMVPCPECGGRLHIPCEVCGGKGSRRGRFCLACEGAGATGCDRCDGLGLVEPAAPPTSAAARPGGRSNGPSRLAEAMAAGNPPWKAGGPTSPAPGAYAAAEAVIAATGAEVRHGAEFDLPHYRRPPDDVICLPPEARFSGRRQLVGTKLHELVHWSEWRTGWRGDEARGELVAEVGQGLLETALGLPHCDDLTNHRKFVRDWLAGMARDPAYLPDAVAQARRAAEFVLGFSAGRGVRGHGRRPK